MNSLKTWSFSTLKDYETCPHRIALRLEGAARPEQSENRGQVIHKHAEQYVKGQVDTLIPELRHFDAQLLADRETYAEGKMQVEEEWAFNSLWEPTGWWSDDVRLRVKLDQFVRSEPDSAVIVDWKSGKKVGNEVPHMQQAQLYALAVMHKYPEIEFLDSVFRYTDAKDIKRHSFRREQDYQRLDANYQRRVYKMQSDEILPPKPNKQNCNYCDYGCKHGSSACGYDVFL